MPLCAAWAMNNEFNYRSRQSRPDPHLPYLNNIVEQDHRRVKSRVGPMLGFKRLSATDPSSTVGS
jgi:transposase-like protein